MTRRRKLAIAGAVTAGVLGGLWIASPAIIKWRIHSLYPEVTVGDAALGWKTVNLKDISFDRKWLSGTITSATVAWGGDDVDVVGGHLDVDLDKKPPAVTGESNGHHVTFRDLTVHVSRGQATVDIVGAYSDHTKVCWTSGSATHPRATVTFISGCAERDGSHANVGQATLSPRDIPHVPVGVALGLATVVYDGKSVTIGEVKGVLELTHSVTLVKVADVTAQNVTITLPAGEARWPTFEVAHLKVTHPWISPDPVTFQNVKAVPDGKSSWHVTINGAVFDVNPEGLAARGQQGQSCQTWVDALPEELCIEPLKWVRFDGNFNWNVDLKATPKPVIDFSSCRVVPQSCVSIKALRKPFTYWVYSPDGDLIERTTGPSTKGWTPLADTGPMQTAVINSEDYGFRSHKGFVPWAYLAALEEDLKAGKFIRGGSTITMQTAKNLWLQRSKTLGRKIQELFLAMALESCMTKDEIMETYLNVIEFGPNVYGIGDGAKFWFHKEPSELEPVEAFWLASILTNPHKAGKPTPEALAKTTKLMQKLMTMGRDLGVLTPPDLLDEVEQPPK